MPIGSITRGTTGTNRLRRIDRWIAQLPAFRGAGTPLVVDLGYGASATTSLELYQRLSRVVPSVEVIGIEIDPARVRLAALSARDGVSFRLGGFEVPLPDGRRATVIRALNVLRQYDEADVLKNWRLMVSRLEPGGVLVEGTCNEIGRVASWVEVTAEGPRTLTISLRLADLERPSIVAERLPKVLIQCSGGRSAAVNRSTSRGRSIRMTIESVTGAPLATVSGRSRSAIATSPARTVSPSTGSSRL
jgi:hypothetical protein